MAKEKPLISFQFQKINPGSRAPQEWTFRACGMLLRARPAGEVRPRARDSTGEGGEDPGKAEDNLQCHLAHEDGCEDVVRHREEDALLKEWEKP